MVNDRPQTEGMRVAMKCRCEIELILAGEDVECIHNLFKGQSRKFPKGMLLAVIDATQNMPAFDCRFLWSWGKEYYCANQNFVRTYLRRVPA